MAERPIIFSAPMVRALLREIEVPGSGKTMTRRLASKLSTDRDGSPVVRPSPWQRVRPGDVLWVRESFAPGYFDDWSHGYGADWTGEAADCVPEPKWKPSIHMPRAAARILLDVTAAKVERLQAITPEDALREGDKGRSGMPEFHARGPLCHVDWFRNLWTDLHGPGAWEANPEVVAITFKPRFADQREHRT